MTFKRFPILKSSLISYLGLSLVLALVGCTQGGDPQKASSETLKVGLVLDKGGRDDKSFNASAFRGAQKAEKELGIQLKTVVASDDTAIEPSLRTFAARGYDVVIAIGFVMGAAVEKVAKQFPKVHFVLVDSTVELPNVKSLMFEEQEGSFLVGALAAMKSSTGTVGFIGGMDIPLIRRFELGYRSGVKAINPQAKVLVNYVGSTSTAWKNPMKGKELALNQYKKGADVVFSPSGASAMGVFDAAEETGKLAIGTDSNQNWIKPGRILTSMVKRIDNAVFQTLQARVQTGAFEAGIFRLGLEKKGVDYAMDEHNAPLVSAEQQARLEELRKQIIQGTLKVPDFYVTKTIPSE